MWYMNCFVIPVTTEEATVIATEGLKRCLETISGKHATD